MDKHLVLGQEVPVDEVQSFCQAVLQVMSTLLGGLHVKVKVLVLEASQSAGSCIILSLPETTDSLPELRSSRHFES